MRYRLNGRDVTEAEFRGDPAAAAARLAAMFAAGTPPMSNTDREFLEARENGRQFQDAPALGDFYAAAAARAGQSVTGKVYLSGLAAYPGDPRAWVADRGDVRRVLEERGWGARGAVNRPADERPPLDDAYRVADDLVAARAAALLAAAGGELAPEDAAEQARRQLSPEW